jgi:serine/threonine protein phosphatase PrpC
VFDGRGGAAASAYLQQNLHAVLQRTLEQARSAAFSERARR